MCIRIATLDDVAAIRAVGVAAWHDTYTGIVPDEYIPWALEKWWTTEAIQRHVLSDHFIVLVAEVNTQIVGMASAQIHLDRSATLWRLYVNHACRGEGIGTRLLDEIQNQLPVDVRVLYIEYYQQNSRAAAFYAAHGFIFDHSETTLFQNHPIVSIFVRRDLYET